MVQIDITCAVSEKKIAKEFAKIIFLILVVYDWVFLATFIDVKWYFDFGHHNGAIMFTSFIARGASTGPLTGGPVGVRLMGWVQ